MISIVDYYRRYSYEAIKLPHTNPEDGFSIIQAPADMIVSPHGWHSDGVKTYTDTRGNNVDVFIGSSTRFSFRPEANELLEFTAKFDPSKTPKENRNASSVHLFYLLNKVHDVTYRYGFTEIGTAKIILAGNFQRSNLGRGGKENDRVEVSNQNPDDHDTSNFASPPDGQAGLMNMYLFTNHWVNRDASFDSVIPMHEIFHGVSSRLTGGAHNAVCLQDVKSKALEEGI